MKLSPFLLLNAYSQGIFPMADEKGEIYWYDPDPRAIFPLDQFHIPRSLRRRLNRRDYEVRYDYDFRAVIRACAAPRPDQSSDETWINGDIIESYCMLHALGFAHSVETWMDGELVGGLYGVALGGLFAGESMFSRVTDASKIALVHLVWRLRERGFVLLDTQFMTAHLERFGAIEVSRTAYKRLLEAALQVQARF